MLLGRYRIVCRVSGSNLRTEVELLKGLKSREIAPNSSIARQRGPMVMIEGLNSSELSASTLLTYA